MKPATPAAPADPVLLLIALAWLAAAALLALTVSAVALVLTLTGWRPAATPAQPSTPPPPALLPPAPLPPAPAPLERLTVAQLRACARAAGLPRLARSGRRAQLLEALAAAPCRPVTASTG